MQKTIATLIAGLFATAAFAQAPAPKTAVLVPTAEVAKAKAKASDTKANQHAAAAKTDTKAAKTDVKEAASSDVKPAKAEPKKTKHSKTAHKPSFSRTWLEPAPADSSPHSVMRPASSRLPKNFQPVGVSKHSTPNFCATRSTAALVGMERATPLMPPA